MLAGRGVCIDLWQGLGGGGIGLYSWDDNRMHINAVWAVADPVAARGRDRDTSRPSSASRAAKTVGTTACAGCSDPGDLGAELRSSVGYLGDTSATILDYPYAGGNQCLTWQNSTLPCAKPVPARNTTWGQVKSLYR